MSELHTNEPLFLANHLALDFVNTAYGVGDDHHDFLTDDASVVSWLTLAGLLPEPFVDIPDGLVSQARALRKTAREMIDACLAGNPCSPAQINQLLEKGQPVSYLEWDYQQAAFRLLERRRDNSSESLLEPIASALARLLSGSERHNVRQCQAHDCTLLFLDTTRSHRRRWCSMALCGNRIKVAAFRSRQHNTQ